MLPALGGPRGIAYEPYMRDNVIRLHCAGWSNASIAEYFHQRPCERTVQEWVQRFKEAPHLGAPAPLPKPGPAPMLSQRDAYGLWAAKCAMPTLSIGAAQQFIFLLSGKFPSPFTGGCAATVHVKKITYPREHKSRRR